MNIIKRIFCRHKWEKCKGWYSVRGWDYEYCPKCKEVKNVVYYTRKLKEERNEGLLQKRGMQGVNDNKRKV